MEFKCLTFRRNEAVLCFSLSNSMNEVDAAWCFFMLCHHNMSVFACSSSLSSSCDSRSKPESERRGPNAVWSLGTRLQMESQRAAGVRIDQMWRVKASLPRWILCLRCLVTAGCTCECCSFRSLVWTLEGVFLMDIYRESGRDRDRSGWSSGDCLTRWLVFISKQITSCSCMLLGQEPAITFTTD